MIPALTSDPQTLTARCYSPTPPDRHSRAGGNPEVPQIDPNQSDPRLRRTPFSLSYTSKRNDRGGRKMDPQLETLDSRLRGNDGSGWMLVGVYSYDLWRRTADENRGSLSFRLS